MARSKRKPSDRARTKNVVTPTESEDLEELTTDESPASAGSPVDAPDDADAETAPTGTSEEQEPRRGRRGKAAAAAGAEDPASKQASKDPVSPKRGTGRRASGSTAAGDEDAAGGDDSAGGKDTRSAKDTKRAAGGSSGKDAAGGTGAKAASAGKDPVAEKAKDAAVSRSPKRSAAAEGARSGRRVAATQNPAWLVPTALTLLILGVVYLVAYYLSAGTLPLPIGDWNLAAGFGIMLVGGGMLMFWK